MSKYESDVRGNIEDFIEYIDKEVVSGSFTASLEETHDYSNEHTKVSVRVYERYSYFGDNRLSLTVTTIQDDKSLHTVGISTGGSQALFFKVNTWGEDNFMLNFKKIVEAYNNQ